MFLLIALEPELPRATPKSARLHIASAWRAARWQLRHRERGATPPSGAFEEAPPSLAPVSPGSVRPQPLRVMAHCRHTPRSAGPSS